MQSCLGTSSDGFDVVEVAVEVVAVVVVAFLRWP